jgi:hypothetical protein
MKIKYALLSWSFLVATLTLAQSNIEGADAAVTEHSFMPNITFDLDMRIASPRGDFKTVYKDDVFFGFGGALLFGLNENSPLDMGLEVSYLYMTGHSSNAQYDAPHIGLYDVDTRITGSMVPINFLTRFYPLRNRGYVIQPYLEVIGGFRIFNVRQKVETYLYRDDIFLEPEEETNANLAWNYGMGMGLNVRINDFWAINMHAQHMFGSQTNYIDPETIEVRENGEFGYNEHRSTTHALAFILGVSLTSW